MTEFHLILKPRHTHTGRKIFTANGVGILIAESNVAVTDLARLENIDHSFKWV